MMFNVHTCRVPGIPLESFPDRTEQISWFYHIYNVFVIAVDMDSMDLYDKSIDIYVCHRIMVYHISYHKVDNFYHNTICRTTKKNRISIFYVLKFVYTLRLHGCFSQSLVCLHFVSQVNSLEHGSSFSCIPQRHFFFIITKHCRKKIKFGTVIKEKIVGKITYSRNSWTMSISNVINLPNCNCPYDIFACMYAIDRATFFGKYHRMYRWFPYKVQLFSIPKEWQIPKLNKMQCSTNAHITYSLSTWA